MIRLKTSARKMARHPSRSSPTEILESKASPMTAAWATMSKIPENAKTTSEHTCGRKQPVAQRLNATESTE